ncbi:MAG: YybS family protein [Synergistaceae bacterium]|nr:YybS family protein [Synergistaceae bacterium]
MEGPNKSQKTFQASFFRCLFLSSMSMLLFCAGSFAPPLGTTAFLFSPTPLALLGARENKTWMAAGLMGSALLLGLVFGPWVFVYFLLDEGFLCFGLTIPLNKTKSGSESLVCCTLLSVFSKVFFVALNAGLGRLHPLMVDPGSLQRFLIRMNASAVSQGGREAALLYESVEQAVRFIPHMLPSVILLSSMLDSFLNYRLCETLQRRRTETLFPALPPFGEWRFPKSLLWSLACAFLLPFFTGDGGWVLWSMLEVNLKFLVLVFFFLQGISLVWWWLSRRAAHVLLRVLVVALLSVLGPWVAALGVGDLCFDFRARKMKKI